MRDLAPLCLRACQLPRHRVRRWLVQDRGSGGRSSGEGVCWGAPHAGSCWACDEPAAEAAGPPARGGPLPGWARTGAARDLSALCTPRCVSAQGRRGPRCSAVPGSGAGAERAVALGQPGLPPLRAQVLPEKNTAPLQGLWGPVTRPSEVRTNSRRNSYCEKGNRFAFQVAALSSVRYT